MHRGQFLIHLALLTDRVAKTYGWYLASFVSADAPRIIKQHSHMSSIGSSSFDYHSRSFFANKKCSRRYFFDTNKDWKIVVSPSRGIKCPFLESLRNDKWQLFANGFITNGVAIILSLCYSFDTLKCTKPVLPRRKMWNVSATITWPLITYLSEHH